MNPRRLLTQSLCCLALTIALFGAITGQQAFAQYDVKPAIDYENIPDKYIAEAQGIYRQCIGTASRMLYYDCKCYSMEFLEERVYQGPNASRQGIEAKLSKQCRDATQAAGFEYGQCLTSTNTMKPGTDPEELCACYANRFAELINEAAPTLQSRSISPYKIQAKIECSDPALARKFYRRAGPR